MARKGSRASKSQKFFHQIEELPRNGSGKILKRILVEQFSGD